MNKTEKELTPLMRLENIHMVFKKPGSVFSDRSIHVLRNINHHP